MKENKELRKRAIVMKILANAEWKTDVIGKKLNKLEKNQVSVNRQKAKGLVDSGCKISVIHKNLNVEEKLKGAGSIYLRLFDKVVKSPLIKLPLAIMQTN